MVDSTQFDVGQAYPVRVSAENIIGTISVANGTFSIQGMKEGEMEREVEGTTNHVFFNCSPNLQ